MKNPSPLSDQSGRNILVIDDNAELRKMVTLFLQRSGFTVSGAENTENARSLLNKEPFDAVVTDVLMPGEDGIQFLSKVHKSYPEIPVILMTGHAELQMALDAIKNGAFDFIQKPFDLDKLNTVVDKAVNFSRQQRLEKKRQKELEDALAERTAELGSAKVELDLAHSKILQAARSKSDIKSGTSHGNAESGNDYKIISRVV